MNRTTVSLLLGAALSLLGAPSAQAGAYLSASVNELDARTHARNFSGSGGELEPIRVCMDVQANEAMAIQAEATLIKVIATLNRLRSVPDHTMAFGAATDIPAGQYDFESVLLHEMLHNHGLAHPNHADEAGLPSPLDNGTKSLPGPNGVYNQAASLDGLHGSADDVRGDDINLHWYQRGLNNPGVLPSTVDETTMARTLSFLPGGHLFAANGDRQVLAALGFVDAEAVMQQGTGPDEAQRHLQHDDVAAIRLARAGLDGVQGTADDYRVQLVYRGRALDPQGEACQIAVRLDNSVAFASSSIGSYRLVSNHWGLFHTRIRLNSAVNWYFSPAANTVTTIVSDLPDASALLQPFTVRVQVNKAPGNPISGFPQGLVEVRDGPRHETSTAFCSFTLAGTPGEIGECQLTPLRSGSKTLVADYLGYAGFDGSSDSEAHLSNGTLQFSAISGSPAPSAVGAPVLFQWTLAPPPGDPPANPSGTVTVKDAVDCASPALNPAHQCTVSLPTNRCAISFASVGSKSMQLCYGGDSAYPASNAASLHQVNAGITTTTTITSNLPSPSAPLGAVVVRVTVRETPSLGGDPAGLLEVRDGPLSDPLTARCSITLAGTANETGECTLVPLRAGARTLTASFAPQSIWAGSSGTAVQPIASFAIVRNQPATSRPRQGVHLTVNLDVSSFLGTPAPTGTIMVSDGVDQCQIVLPASECLWFGSTSGARSLVASWPGDANYPPRTSAAVIQNVEALTWPQLVSNPRSGFADSNGASSSTSRALSADGRFLVFTSAATQLVNGDSNGQPDIFIRDQRSGLVRRISTSASDAQANGPSREATISANGRFVAFTSLASNLVAADTNNVVDVFVKDLSDGSIVRATLKSNGNEDTTLNDFFVNLSPSLSADGRYVAFQTGGQLIPADTSIHNDIYVRDLTTGALDPVSSNNQDNLGDFRSFAPSISADGRYVAFQSQAFNFADQDHNDTADVFRKDRLTRAIAFVSSDAAGVGGLDATDPSFAPEISADGRYVVFTSLSNHLVPNDVNNNYDVFLKDVQTGAIEKVSSNSAGVPGNVASEFPSMSADARYVVFRSSSTQLVSGDTNALMDVFLKDRQTGATTRINLQPTGVQTTAGASEMPAISADGRFISYQSAASTLVTADGNGQVDVFVRDRLSVPSVRASAVHPGARPDGDSAEASISRDGRFVAFGSAASNIVSGDANSVADIFVQDRVDGSIVRLSQSAAGVAANAASDSSLISGDGQWIVFRSSASTLIAGDSNNAADIYLKQRQTGAIERVSTASGGGQLATGQVRAYTSLSHDASKVLFHASDSNLVAGDNNGFDDVFLKNRSTDSTSILSRSAAGVPGNGHSAQAQISDDGTRVVFASEASNLTLTSDTNSLRDIYVKSLLDGTVLLASSDASGNPGNGASSNPAISSDGRLVAFTSAASNLVPGDSNGLVDVFVKDLSDGSISRVSTAAAGLQASGGDCSGGTAFGSNGRYVSFACAMVNLVPADSNNLADVFVKDLLTGAITRSSISDSPVQANAASTSQLRALSDNGLMVFASSASTLITAGDDSFSDVFVNRFAYSAPIATTTVITAHNPNPSPRDSAYLVSVSVTRSGGSANLTGNVRISEGSNFCFAILSGSGASATGSCALSTFSVGSKTLNASYGGDLNHAASDASSVSHSVAPIVPTAPLIGEARAGNAEVQVNFSAPLDNGGATVTGYSASCAGQGAIGTASPLVVTGLSNGVTVTCTVTASNSAGVGPPSMMSNAVTPNSGQTIVGPFAYVPRFNTGQMAVIDLGSNTIIASINGGSGIGIALNPDGSRAYAVDQGSNTVRVINTVTKTLLTTINVGQGPWSAVVSPDGARVYVSNRNTNTVSVIDASNNTVISTFGVASAPTALVIAPDNSKLYVGSGATLNLSVVSLPALTVNQVNIGTTSHALAIHPDGSRVYAVNGQALGRVLALDTSSNTVVGNVSVGNTPLGLSISPDGSRLYASNNRSDSVSQIDTVTMTVIGTGATGPRPIGLDVLPNGSRIYVGNNNGTMSVLNTVGMLPNTTISMGSADAIYAVGNFIARTSTPTADRRLAVGTVTLPATGAGANPATRVFFPLPFIGTPVVIVQPDNQDADPKALRLININSSGFDVLQVEPTGCAGCNGAGGAMTVHWLAALPGAYRLSNDDATRNRPSPLLPGPGVLVKVGSVLTMASQRSTLLGGFTGFAPTSWNAVDFPVVSGYEFSSPPIVLSQVQSWEQANTAGNLSVPLLPGRPTLTGPSRIWMTTAVRNITSTRFETALESSSSDDSGSPTPGLRQPESIGYVAIEAPVSTQLVALGGSMLGLATGLGSVNDGCSSINLNFPSASVINAANLRGFVGLHSRNEDDGGWLRRCTLSNPAGSSVRMTARIDEDAHLSSDRSHPTAEAVGSAIFGGDFTTTPVTLAYLQSARRGEQLDVQFGSATEAGHLGYRIWGRPDRLSEWQPLHQDLIVSISGDGFTSKNYQRSVVALDSSEIRIEDVDVRGVSRFHPAQAVGAQAGSPAIEQPLDWSAIRASNRATVVPARRSAGASEALAEVQASGIQRVGFAELSAAGFAAGSPAAAIAVLEDGQPQPRFIQCPSASFGPGCTLEWLGRTRDSLYGQARTYVITVDPAAAIAVGTDIVASTTNGLRTVTAEVQQAPDRSYSFSAPGNDPWYDERLVATSSPVELQRNFSLPQRVSGPVTLSVQLWGGMDFPGSAPDHSVELLLNGQVLTRRRFDGLNSETISLPLSDSLLQASNTLTLRLPADTGYSADVVLLDGLKLGYSRSTTVDSGELQFGTFQFTGGAESAALLVNGFEDRAGFTVAGVAGLSTVWTQLGNSLQRLQLTGNSLLDTRISALLLADEAHVRTPLVRPSVAALTDLSPVDYLIVTHPLFEAGLAPLIALQQSRGYTVRVVRTDEIYAARSFHQRNPLAIRETIAAINPRFVLLIGGDSYDYDNHLGLGSLSYLPTFYRVADPIVRFAPSDLAFADQDGNGTPERAIGRLPVRTMEELQRVVSAISERGNSVATRYFASAGGSSASEHFDIHSRSLLSFLRQGQSTTFALTDEIGLSDARAQTTAALAGAADWINYLGHSSPNRWAIERLLDTSLLAPISRSGLPAIVSQWGCWNNYFVLPSQDTMSHALMLRSNRLAAVVIGSTSLAEDQSHMALGTRFFDLVEDGRFGDAAGTAINTIGEALLEAKRNLASNAPEHLESNWSITLFGDPAMPLR